MKMATSRTAAIGMLANGTNAPGPNYIIKKGNADDDRPAGAS